jgi:hypothetical protein
MRSTPSGGRAVMRGAAPETPADLKDDTMLVDNQRE